MADNLFKYLHFPGNRGVRRMRCHLSDCRHFQLWSKFEAHIRFSYFMTQSTAGCIVGGRRDHSGPFGASTPNRILYVFPMASCHSGASKSTDKNRTDDAWWMGSVVILISSIFHFIAKHHVSLCRVEDAIVWLNSHRHCRSSPSQLH